MSRRFVPVGLAAALALAFAAPAAQAAWPDRPLRLVVPYAAGGPTDVVARQIANQLGDKLGQSVIVENKPGAGGTIGVDYVVRAAADGYTFGLVAPGPLAGMPQLMQVPYALEDINYLTVVGRIPSVVVVNAGGPVKDLKGLVDAAKAKPGTLNYGSAGDGTTPHIGMELFKKAAGADILHIPYKGAAPAVIALLSGEVDVTMVDLLPVLPHVRAGKLTAVAVASKERAPQLPDVPTMGELGYPNVLMDTLYGVISPKGLPDDVQKAVTEAIHEAVNSDAVRKQYDSLGVLPMVSSGQEYQALTQAEFEKWRGVIADANIKLQ
ncbi:tripartite tricarboxylate transporter substrate binding protein [Achromobacter sp. GG226]|uniref:Bug family tripartite tricarboxylate transporter substrate binding protein n=1 Tax=Verticiella alkaliphila TaxID=2779529 RepID=UPI001C0AFB02|nr:tripartite tricarboxylate transporter substrate binding protein [Verticiella sp. GG226]MBU4611550.1 tripartite tricarboxylate transporter substrate binding protein [Verticiella sp. GG226]